MRPQRRRANKAKRQVFCAAAIGSYALFSVIFLALLLVACPKSTYQAAAQAADGVAKAVGAATKIDEDLFHDGSIDGDIAREVAEALKGINFANQEFIKDIQAIHTAGGTRAQYITAAQKVADSLQVLNQEQVIHGLLRIKNPDSRAKLTTAIEGIRTAVSLLISNIGGTQ